eukprot:m.82732 g.82732  ORF g.82732 m.82732 type:complete len:357 (-) comp50791_c0_seq7:90-1160(-)
MEQTAPFGTIRELLPLTMLDGSKSTISSQFSNRKLPATIRLSNGSLRMRAHSSSQRKMLSCRLSKPNFARRVRLSHSWKLNSRFALRGRTHHLLVLSKLPTVPNLLSGQATKSQLSQKEKAVTQKDSEHQATKVQLAQLQQTLSRSTAEHQATREAFASECTAHKSTQVTLAVREELAHYKAAATTARLQQDVQGLAKKGHKLTLDDIYLLAQFWKLDIRPETLQASSLALQGILDLSSATLKRKLACNYGTGVALVSFLRKLVDGGELATPRTGRTDLLDKALEKAKCASLKSAFVAQGVADDVLFGVDLDVLGHSNDEIADHIPELKQAIQECQPAPSVTSSLWGSSSLLLQSD